MHKTRKYRGRMDDSIKIRYKLSQQLIALTTMITTHSHI